MDFKYPWQISRFKKQKQIWKVWKGDCIFLEKDMDKLIKIQKMNFIKSKMDGFQKFNKAEQRRFHRKNSYVLARMRPI